LQNSLVPPQKKKRRANHTLLMFANDNNNNPATGACLYFISCGNRQIVIFILASFSEQCTASLIENVKEKIFSPESDNQPFGRNFNMAAASARSRSCLYEVYITSLE